MRKRLLWTVRSSLGRIDAAHGSAGLVLHLGTRFWLDWKQDAESLGKAEHASGIGWEAAGDSPWLDPTWVGLETARKNVAALILP